jgi:hypothetical protein
MPRGSRFSDELRAYFVMRREGQQKSEPGGARFGETVMKRKPQLAAGAATAATGAAAATFVA